MPDDDIQMQHPLRKEVPGHLFQFEEKIFGLSIQHLLGDVGSLVATFALTAGLPLGVRLGSCLLAGLAAAILLHSHARGYPLLTWLMLGIRLRLLPRHTTWQRAGDQRTGSRRREPSVQDAWLPLASLDHGMLAGQPGRMGACPLWAVLEVEGPNVSLLPEEDQIRIYQRYATFLCGLAFPLKWLSLVTPIDPRQAPALLAQQQALAQLKATPRLRRLLADSLAYQHAVVQSCTTTRHMVVVGAQAADVLRQRMASGSAARPSLLTPLWQLLSPNTALPVSDAQVRDVLRTRISILQKALHQLDVRARVLDDADVLAVFAASLALGAAVPSYQVEILAQVERRLPAALGPQEVPA